MTGESCHCRQGRPAIRSGGGERGRGERGQWPMTAQRGCTHHASYTSHSRHGLGTAVAPGHGVGGGGGGSVGGGRHRGRGSIPRRNAAARFVDVVPATRRLRPCQAGGGSEETGGNDGSLNAAGRQACDWIVSAVVRAYG